MLFFFFQFHHYLHQVLEQVAKQFKFLLKIFYVKILSEKNYN